MKRMTLPERIDDLLHHNGTMSFYDLAVALWPDGKAHRGAVQGGPPGCYMALSAAIRRGHFYENHRGVGPGNRMVHARGSSVSRPASNSEAK